jgi:hypothetical protein
MDKKKTCLPVLDAVLCGTEVLTFQRYTFQVTQVRKIQIPLKVR